MAEPVTALNSTTVFGGSYMAYGNPAFSGGSGGETSVSNIGIVNDAMRKTGPGFDLTNLRAQGGSTVFAHRDQQLPLVLADATECVWYNSSPNAYNDALSGSHLAQADIIAAEKTIMAACAANKRVVVWLSMYPLWKTGSSGAAARVAEFPAHVEAMRVEAAKYANVIYLNVYDQLRDPASADLNPLPNYIQLTDGIHPTTWGARFIGEFIAPIIAARVALTKYRAVGANIAAPFSSTGGSVTPGAGTINGVANVPAGWDVGILTNGVTTVTASQPSPGVLRLACTNTATQTASIIQLTATNAAAMLAALAQGDVIQNGFDFATLGNTTKLTRLSAYVRLNGNASWRTMQRDTSVEPAADFKYNNAQQSGRRWSHPWLIDVPVTQVEHIIQIGIDPGSNATIDFSMPVLQKMGAATEVDTTAPVMVGEIEIANISTSGATLSCQAATDAVGVTGYEYSINGGSSYSLISNAGRSVVISGRPAGTLHEVRMRALDAAGNRAAPLAKSFTTLAAQPQPPAQDAVIGSTVAESRRVAFPGGTRVVAFGSSPAARMPNAPYFEAGKWWSEKHPLDERYWVADITIDLAERKTTATSVVAIVAGVVVLEQPVIQGKLIPVKLGGFNAATGAANFCTFRITCANGERFDRTIWFKQQVGSWSLEKDADDESYIVADISNDLADSNTTASAVLAQPVGVGVLVPAAIQGSLILVKLGGMDTLPAGVNYCDLRIDCANGERFYRTIQFNRVDN